MTEILRLFGDSDADPIVVEDVGLSIRFWQGFLADADADSCFELLLNNTPWDQPQVWMYGRFVKTPRLTCWYGDPGASYVYSGIKNEPLPWTPTLGRLRDQVVEKLKYPVNSVLLNLYRDGRDHLSWHKDDEKELAPDPNIASISLGAERVFALRTKNPEARQSRYEIKLNHGSLLHIGGQTQTLWQHCIKKEPRVCAPRVNLTFRYVRVTG